MLKRNLETSMIAEVCLLCNPRCWYDKFRDSTENQMERNRQEAQIRQHRDHRPTAQRRGQFNNIALKKSNAQNI